MKHSKTKAQIQNKWDTILCRFAVSKIRLKESYYDIARFATGERFEGTRRDLQEFVLSLELDRMVEITAYKGILGGKARNDFRYAIKAHSNIFIEDCFKTSPIEVKMNITSYKWKDLSSKRVIMSERKTQDGHHVYTSKGGIGSGCSDWQTVK